MVFVDIALAQIATLGATAAFLFGYELETWQSYTTALGFSILGALVLALTCDSHEAVIGVVYAVSSDGAVLLADRTPHGAEHLRGMLVDSILSVRGGEVLKVAVLYAAIGLIHWLCSSLLPDLRGSGYRLGGRCWVRICDFLSYASFGVVLTSSVRIAGVLLVFSYLIVIVPALPWILLAGRIGLRLAVGWVFGAGTSIIAMLASAVLDLPTGATVVCAFGLSLPGLVIALRSRRA